MSFLWCELIWNEEVQYLLSVGPSYTLYLSQKVKRKGKCEWVKFYGWTVNEEVAQMVQGKYLLSERGLSDKYHRSCICRARKRESFDLLFFVSNTTSRGNWKFICYWCQFKSNQIKNHKLRKRNIASHAVFTYATRNGCDRCNICYIWDNYWDKLI